MFNSKATVGYNVVGFVSRSFGLGVAARNTIAQLLEHNFPVAIYDIPLGDGSRGLDLSYKYLESSFENPIPYPITIFHTTPAMAIELLSTWPPQFFKQTYITCVPFWELSKIPNSWIKPSQMIGTILAPTHFIQHAFDEVPNIHVLHYPQSLTLPGYTKMNRSDLRIASSTILFATAFDIGSDLNRKNPLGAINSFCGAFPSGTEDVALVIKVNRTVSTPYFDQLLKRLNQFASQDRRIIVIDRSMSYAEILSLYSLCDVYISLHRGEGLGLPIMENMTLGKPVVVTNYSGVTDFINSTNACLVDFVLAECDSSLNLALKPEQLGFQGYWAEPDLNGAVSWLKKLADSKILRETIGANAFQSIQRWKLECKKGIVFKKLWQLYEMQASRVNCY